MSYLSHEFEANFFDSRHTSITWGLWVGVEAEIASASFDMISASSIVCDVISATTLFARDATISNASTTNLWAVNGTITGLHAAYASITSGSASMLYAAYGSLTNGSATSLYASYASLTSGSASMLYAAYGSLTNGSATSLYASYGSLTSGSASSLYAAFASMTRLGAEHATISFASISYLRGSAFVGELRLFAAANTTLMPSRGWLVCDGAWISRADYADLFAVIGTTYGAGNGVTTFQLPDLRGRVPVAQNPAGDGGLVVRTIGATAGADTKVLDVSEMPAHDHNVSLNAVSNHQHTYQDAYFAENAGGGGSVFGTSAAADSDNIFRWRTSGGLSSTVPQDLLTGAAGSHVHTVNESSIGGGAAFSLLQPSLVVGYWYIYAGVFT